MKKNYRKLVNLANAVDAAAPASVWGSGVPGKHTARNFDSGFRADDILKQCFGIRLADLKKAPETGQSAPSASNASGKERPSAA